MKILLNCLNKLKINKFTVFVISISLITGRFIPLFIYFLIASIHEISHCIVAKLFGINIIEIEFLPFGMSAKLSSLDEIHPIKSIIILLAGPLSYFISFYVIFLLYRIGVFSFYTYNLSNEINSLIFFFNLLPIWPLDGAKIVFYISSFFLTLKKSYYFVIILSIISTFILTILTIQNPQIIILLFLVLSQIKFLFEYSIFYIKILFYRLGKEVNYAFKIHNKKDIFLPFTNIYDNGDLFLIEKEFVKLILESKK